MLNFSLDFVSGFGAIGQIELARENFKTENYSLHATWMTQLGMSTLKSKTNYSMIHSSTAIGALFRF